MRVPKEILDLVPYQPGKPIAETKREFGLKDVIKLASNENPLGTSLKVKQALSAALAELHLYPDGSAFELTQALSGFLKITPEELVLGNGSNELIDLLLKVYCRPGDAILTSEKAFIAYAISAQAAQVRVLATPMTVGLKFDLAAMAEVLKKDASIRLVFIANPNNPTGTYVGGKDLRQFLKVAQAHEVLVVLDEAYVEYVTSADYENGLQLRQEFPQVLVLRTFSKAYGLAALRLGFLIAPPEVSGLLHRVRNPFNVNSLAQVAAVAALADQEFVRRAVALNTSERARLEKALTQMGLKVTPSQGNFVLFDTGRDSEKVFKALLKRGIIVRPVKNYGLKTHLRLSVGRPEENQAALDALADEMRE